MPVTAMAASAVVALSSLLVTMELAIKRSRCMKQLST